MAAGEQGTTTAGTAGTERAIDRRPIWKHGGQALVVLVAFSIAQGLMTLLAVVQFATMLIVGEANRHIADFGRSLAMWQAEASAFLTGATARRPFPFASWPAAD